ncbi:MAG: DUF6421 family protein [Bacillota bacterium]
MLTINKLNSQPWTHTALEIIDTCNKVNNNLALLNSGVSTRALVIKLCQQLVQIGKYFPKQETYLKTLILDIDEWISRGLDSPFYVDRTLDMFKPVECGEFGVFLFPIKNSSHENRFDIEAFVYYRNEPQLLKSYRYLYDKPVFQGMELLIGTNGIWNNNIFTLFPEQLVVRKLNDQKKFAFFFINKYLDIFFNISKPLSKVAIENNLLVWQASKNEIYDARSIFSFVHDHFHFIGSLPFDQFYKEKGSLLSSCFEEIRVDALTFVELRRIGGKTNHLASEIILIERLLRYAYTDKPNESFDCLTNLFFFSYLLKAEAIYFNNGKITLNMGKITHALIELNQEIDRLEQEMICDSTEAMELMIKTWLENHIVINIDGSISSSLFRDWLIRAGSLHNIPHQINIEREVVI